MKKIKIVSPKLGEIEYSEDDLITLTTPLLGFNELNDFLLISNTTSFPFFWLQSVEDPDICFILIEPSVFMSDYDPTIPKRELKVLAINDINEAKVFAIVVIPSNPNESTANLRAPLVINFEKKLAKQIILDDDKYLIKTPLFIKE